MVKSKNAVVQATSIVFVAYLDNKVAVYALYNVEGFVIQLAIFANRAVVDTLNEATVFIENSV